jgi:hypothetical protein
MSSLVKQITQLEFQLTDVEARQLTDDIKETADQLWKLLLRAYEGKAWKALGYPTWEAYTNAEFDMSRDYAYKVLRQGRVIRALEEAVNVYNCIQEEPVSLHLKEYQTRQIAPIIETVTARIQEEVIDVPREQVQEIVAKVVQEEREKLEWRKQVREDAVALAKETGTHLTKDEVIAEDARLAIVCPVYEAIEEITKLPSVDSFVQNVKPWEKSQLSGLDQAINWLSELARQMEVSK